MTDSQEVQRIPLKRECPKCGKSVSLRGLPGHLRFSHGVNSKKVPELIDQSRIDETSKAERVFEIMDELRELRDRLKQVNEMDEGDWFREDKACTMLRELLKKKEKELLNELQELAPVREDFTIDEFFFGRRK